MSIYNSEHVPEITKSIEQFQILNSWWSAWNTPDPFNAEAALRLTMSTLFRLAMPSKDTIDQMMREILSAAQIGATSLLVSNWSISDEERSKLKEYLEGEGYTWQEHSNDGSVVSWTQISWRNPTDRIFS